MTSQWQQLNSSARLRGSLEEITDWIDSGQPLPLTGIPVAGEFPFGGFTNMNKQNLAAEKANSASYGVNNTYRSSYEAGTRSEQISEATQRNRTNHSLSFVPIAPATLSYQLNQQQQHNSDRLEPTDEFLKEVTDLSGTTAHRGRKMTSTERDIMLYKRKLRNRDSASRSRKKKKMIVEDLNNQLDSLISFYQSKEEETENLLSQADKNKMKLLDERQCLVKELESLGAELRKAKEELKNKQKAIVEKCMQQKAERLSNPNVDDDLYENARQRSPLVMGESDRNVLETISPKSSRLVRS